MTEVRPVRRADNLTAFMCRLSWNLGVSTSCSPLGLYTVCFILPFNVKAPVILNVGNYLRYETASHPGRSGSSVPEQIVFQRRQLGQWLIPSVKFWHNAAVEQNNRHLARNSCGALSRYNIHISCITPLGGANVVPISVRRVADCRVRRYIVKLLG